MSTCVESHHQTIKMFRPTQASPLRLLKKDGINTCLTVGGESRQPWLHILGNSMQKALMLTSSPIFTGPSKNKQLNLIQSQINVCSACGKNILFYMNHGMLLSTKEQKFLDFADTRSAGFLSTTKFMYYISLTFFHSSNLI